MPTLCLSEIQGHRQSVLRGLVVRTFKCSRLRFKTGGQQSQGKHREFGSSKSYRPWTNGSEPLDVRSAVALLELTSLPRGLWSCVLSESATKKNALTCRPCSDLPSVSVLRAANVKGPISRALQAASVTIFGAGTAAKIIRGRESARGWENLQRDEGVTVISGFHSRVEKECLRILLRGKQPIIICLARAMEKIRLPSAWCMAMEGNRLLILSPFEKRPPRPTVESARQRNELVAALSDEALIIHATPGGQIERIAAMVDQWGIQRRTDYGLGRDL